MHHIIIPPFYYIVNSISFKLIIIYLETLLDKLQNLEIIETDTLIISEILDGIKIDSSFIYSSFLGEYIYISGKISANIPDNSYLFKTNISIKNVYPLFISIDMPTSYIGQGNAWLRGDGKVQLVSPFNISSGIYGFYTTLFIPR